MPDNIFGQNLELSAGLYRNTFFDLVKDEGHFQTRYITKNGYSINSVLGNVKIGKATFLFDVRLDQYNGHIYTTTGGLGSIYSVNAEVEKTALGLGLYPVTIPLGKIIDINLGIEFNYVLLTKMNGYKKEFSMGFQDILIDLSKNPEAIEKKCTSGIVGRLNKEISIAKSLYISLTYKCYLGLITEFFKAEAYIYSFRQGIELGIGMKLNNQ